MAGIQTEVKPKKKTSYQTAMFSKIDQFAQTPPDVMEHIQKVFNKGNKMYDPCPANRPEGFDGLSDECEWKEVNYVNPPYKSVEPWLVRGLEEVKKGKKVVYLIPARCDVEWWHKYILPNATSIYFINIQPLRKIIRFLFKTPRGNVLWRHGDRQYIHWLCTASGVGYMKLEVR